ncbi:magnesium/cobalt transporter CorA [Exiguobacterium flavidum]|uniref:magnesium/cobalt transporter CorA n=1 Tax=Exiguobacterium flavidum TaxID=2184695 RepID=UPI000DF730B5|nr:magnesium/cobalt transporter CorA [Exiguobacterium flavidum]
MIRTLLITDADEVILDPSFDRIFAPDVKWYWVDFNQPTEEERQLLATRFNFHPLEIEDCFHFLQRPKLEYYEDHSFFVLHAIEEETLDSLEVNLFVSNSFLVSYHEHMVNELDTVWKLFSKTNQHRPHLSLEITHKIMDKIVDAYFPIVHSLEDQIFALEGRYENKGGDKGIIEDIFDIRSDLLELARTVIPMRDLLYRVLESKRLSIQEHRKAFFQDIYDHLIKLSGMIEYNREMTSELRENFVSLNSYRMNNIMKTLTVITTIFMPLTFIAGVYGMNFENMPELRWKYGYFLTLGAMLLIGVSMGIWFKKKRWFEE